MHSADSTVTVLKCTKWVIITIIIRLQKERFSRR